MKSFCKEKLITKEENFSEVRNVRRFSVMQCSKQGCFCFLCIWLILVVPTARTIFALAVINSDYQMSAQTQYFFFSTEVHIWLIQKKHFPISLCHTKNYMLYFILRLLLCNLLNGISNYTLTRSLPYQSYVSDDKKFYKSHV